MKIKISSTGEIQGTTIIDVDSGVDLTSLVSDVKFTHAAGELPKAEITMHFIEIEASGKLLASGSKDGWATHRVVKSITFADGETLDFS